MDGYGRPPCRKRLTVTDSGSAYGTPSGQEVPSNRHRQFDLGSHIGHESWRQRAAAGHASRTAPCQIPSVKTCQIAPGVTVRAGVEKGSILDNSGNRVGGGLPVTRLVRALTELLLSIWRRQRECHRTGLPSSCWSASFGQGPACGTSQSAFCFRNARQSTRSPEGGRCCRLRGVFVSGLANSAGSAVGATG